MGSPNDINPARLIGETDLKCVIIAPVYRLAILGFLSSVELSQEAAAQGEPSGNQGFWDQRIALEWAYEYARYFGGNRSNITIAGYSAGLSIYLIIKEYSLIFQRIILGVQSTRARLVSSAGKEYHSTSDYAFEWARCATQSRA